MDLQHCHTATFELQPCTTVYTQTVNVGAATANPAECSHLSRQKVPGLAFRHPLCGCFVSVASALHKIADACAQHEDPNNPGQEQVPSPS